MNDTNYSAPALERGLKILECFNAQVKVNTTQSLADSLAVSPSSLYRILNTLVELRYLVKISRNTYKLGPAVASKGFAFLASRDIIDVAASYINELRDQVSMSCHLALRDGRDCLYIYRALASQRLSVNVPVGTRIPCHASALGRALLLNMNDQELNRLYLGFQLDSVQSSAPRSLPELKNELKQESLNGYTVSRSDYATALAIPLYSYTGEILAALNTSGPDVFMQNSDIGNTVLQALQKTAYMISAELGGETFYN
jgi:DNA-binding IclR family transcriptional regulator